MEHADAAHPSPPRPKSGLEMLQKQRILRADGPHNRPSIEDRDGPEATDEWPGACGAQNGDAAPVAVAFGVDWFS